MTVKEWLSRGKMLDIEINNLLREQRKAFDEATRMTAKYETEKIKSSNENATEDRYIKYSEYADEINKRIDRLYEIKLQILKAIYCLRNCTYRIVLIKRYINFDGWNKIADDMSYSTAQIYRLHGYALQEMRRKLKDESK